MKARIALASIVAVTLALLPAASALADSGTHTYMLEMERPNTSEASNGDRVTVTGTATFTVHPNAIVDGSGTFTHRTASGALVAAGTWRATDLMEFVSYGCGVVHNFPTPGATTPLPPNFCGGMAKMTIIGTPNGTTVGIPAILTVFCIVGPNPPNSHDDPSGEGITLVVPQHLNFNKIVEGMNIYIQVN
jgi:hypothetical protein